MTGIQSLRSVVHAGATAPTNAAAATTTGVSGTTIPMNGAERVITAFGGIAIAAGMVGIWSGMGADAFPIAMVGALLLGAGGLLLNVSFSSRDARQSLTEPISDETDMVRVLGRATTMTAADQLALADATFTNGWAPRQVATLANDVSRSGLSSPQTLQLVEETFEKGWDPTSVGADVRELASGSDITGDEMIKVIEQQYARTSGG